MKDTKRKEEIEQKIGEDWKMDWVNYKIKGQVCLEILMTDRNSI